METSKIIAGLAAIVHTLKAGIPIAGNANVTIEVPPVNVQVESTKSITDFALAKFEDTGTYMYLAKTNGNTGKCIIIRIHADLSETGYVLGSLADLTTLWNARSTATYTNNVVL